MSDPYPSEYERAIHHSGNSSRVTEADFHRAIHENPEDDLNSLAYADWLEENGKPGHAEYIRKSVAEPVRLPPSTYPRPYSVFPTLSPGHTEIRVYNDGVGTGKYLLEHSVQSLAAKDRAIRWITKIPTRPEVKDLVSRMVSEGAKMHASAEVRFPELIPPRSQA